MTLVDNAHHTIYMDVLHKTCVKKVYKFMIMIVFVY